LQYSDNSLHCKFKKFMNLGCTLSFRVDYKANIINICMIQLSLNLFMETLITQYIY